MKELPIVYVRGFAGGTNGINTQVDDPFYGFNDGCTHIRVDGDGVPRFYQFESPLLRLMMDHHYQLLVHGGQRAYLENYQGKDLAKNSIWIHRFYDEAATTFSAPVHRSPLRRIMDAVEDHIANPKKFKIEAAAEELYELILLILDKTGAGRVYLVAHSMGGLVARSMLQKICQQQDPQGKPRIPASELVDKFFTYATPHGGIDFEFSALDWAMDAFGPVGADIFAPDKMYGYLDKDATWGDRAPAKWDPQEISPQIFEPDRIFCLIGTDPTDYTLTRDVVGPESDGLVRIKRAYVRNANRAYVHRSHSGRYGEVNSEEGYQNLRRFLFGAYQVKVDLRGLPAPDQAKGRRPNEVWQADLKMTIRDLPIVLHEQLAAHYCPILLDREREQHADGKDAPIPLTTVFLLDPATASTPGDSQQLRARYALSLRVFHLTQHNGSYSWDSHLEQTPDREDTLIVDVGRNADDPVTATRAWLAWNSQVMGAPDRFDPISNGLQKQADHKACTFTEEGNDIYCDVPLPEVSQPIPCLGSNAHLRLTVSRRD